MAQIDENFSLISNEIKISKKKLKHKSVLRK